MSDIGDLHIKTTLDVGDATSASAILRSSLSQLTTQIASYANAVQKASSIQKNLDFVTQRSSNSLGILASRQSAVSQAVQGTNIVVQGAIKNLEALNRTMAIVGASGGPKLIANLRAQQSQLQAVAGSARNLESALRSASLSQWANKSRASLAQANRSFYGFSAATLPLIRGLRTAFFSFADLETQTVRYTKLISDNYGGSVERAAAATAVLSKQLDQVTSRFGVSRVLVQAIAGDFAELGVTQIDAVKGLVELTATVEKLGNVDIQQSQKFIESILQNILRVKRDAGEIVDLTDAKFMSNVIAELRGQLAEFNLIENKTTLSLKDMADAFPEVSAAATTFGLSMSETMAVLAPMVAAGYQVGASANSIKVSLQRMVAMTKQNTQIIGDLNKALGPDFNYAAGVSIENIQKLTDGFNALQESYGEQGVLELFARLYGVRQGPRMETTFRQLAKFQTSLSTVGTIENRIASTIERNVNTRLKAYNGEEIAVRNMIDISSLNRKSNEEVNGVLTERAKIIKEGQKQAFDDLSKFNTESADFLSQVSSESGKILLSTAFRIEDTAVAQMEKEIDLQLSTTITKFRILKESVIEIGRVFVTAFKPLIEFLIPIVSKVKDFFNNLGNGAKIFLSFVTAVALLVPGFKLLTTAVKFFGISAFLGFSKITSSLTGVGNRLITVEDLFTKGAKAMRGYKEAVQFTDNSILLSGRKRGNMPSLSGLSLPVQEKLMQTNLVPGFGTDNKLLKSFFGKNAPNLNMPSTMQVAKTLNESGDAVKTAAKSVKNGADSVASAAEKASEDIAESIANSFKNNTFINNKFIGNNQFGDGTSGRGPNGVRGGPSGGPQTTPAAPPITTPVVTPSDIPATPVPNRPGAVENTLQQTLARLNDKLKQIKFLPVGAPAGLEQLIPPARLDPTEYLKRSSGDLSEFVKRMKINLAGLTPFPFVPKSFEDAGQLVPPSLQKLALPRGVPTSVEQVIPPSLKRLALPKVATIISQTADKATDMVELHLYELLDVYRTLNIPIPDELQYLNGVQRSFNVTKRQKEAVLERLDYSIQEQENLIKDEIKRVAKKQGVSKGSFSDPYLKRLAIQKLQEEGRNVTFPFADIVGSSGKTGPKATVKTRLTAGTGKKLTNIVASQITEVDKIVLELIGRHIQSTPVRQLPFFANLDGLYGKVAAGARLEPGFILKNLKQITSNLDIGFRTFIETFFDENASFISRSYTKLNTGIRKSIASKFLETKTVGELTQIGKIFPSLADEIAYMIDDVLPAGIVKGPLMNLFDGAAVKLDNLNPRAASSLGEALHAATNELIDTTGTKTINFIDSFGARTSRLIDAAPGILGAKFSNDRIKGFNETLMRSMLPVDKGGRSLKTFNSMFKTLFNIGNQGMFPDASTVSNLFNIKEEAAAIDYVLSSQDNAIQDLIRKRMAALSKGDAGAVTRKFVRELLPLMQSIEPGGELFKTITSGTAVGIKDLVAAGLDPDGLGVQITDGLRDEGVLKIAAARDIAQKMKKIGGVKKIQVLEKLLIESEIQKILSSTDEAVRIALQEQVGNVQRSISGFTPVAKNKFLSEYGGSLERSAAAQMVQRKGFDLRVFNPASELYNDAAEGALLRNKTVVDAVRAQFEKMGLGLQDEGRVLTTALDSMIADSTPEMVEARRGFVKVFRQKMAGLALPTGPVGKTIGGLTRSIAEYVAQLESLGAVDPAVPVHRFKTQAVELFRRKLPAVFDSRNILGMLPARFIGGVGEVVDNFKKITLEQVIPQQLALPRTTGFGRGEVSKALRLSQFVKRMQDVMVQDMISNLQKLIPAAAPPAARMSTTGGVRRTFSGILRNLPVISGGSQLAGLADAALASAKTVGDGLDNFLKQIFAQFPMDTDAKKIFARVAAEVLSKDAMGPTATLMAREATLAGQKVADSFDFRGIPLTNVVKNNLKKALDSIAPALYEAIDLSLNKGMRIEKGDFTAVTAPDGKTFSEFKKKAKEMFTSDTMKARVSKFKKLASNLRDLSLVTQGALIDAVQAGAYAATAEAGETAESAVRKTLLARARQAGVNIKALKGFKWFDSTLQEALAALSANLSALRDDVAKDVKSSSKKISEAIPQIGVDAGAQQPASGDPAPKPARKPRVPKVVPIIPNVTEPIKEASNKVSKALALTADEIAKQAEIFKATFGEYPVGYQPPKPVIPAASAPATAGAAAGATVQEVFDEVKQDIASPIESLTIETKKSSDKISGAIQKQILEFDESLANFFKGPNLFQGPNIFQGPIQSGDNYDIKTVRRRGAAADVAQAAAARGAVAEEAVSNLTPSSATVEMLKAKNATKKLREMERRRTEKGVSPMTEKEIARAKQLLGIQDQVTLAANQMINQMTLAQRVTGQLKARSASAFSKIASSISSANQALVKTIPGLRSFEVGLASIAGLGVSKAIGNTVKQTLLLQGAMLKAVAAEAKLFVSSLSRSKSLKALLFFATAGFSALGKSIFGASKNLISFTKQQGFAGGIKNAVASLTGGIARTGFSIAGLIIKFGAIGIIVIPIIIMIASLFKQLKGGLTNIEPVMNNFRAAWAAIKEAISAIASPFKDFINSLMGLDGLETQTAKTAGVLYSLSLVVLRISRAFKSFAEGPLRSFIGKMREATDKKTVGTLIPFLTRMINRFILVWEAFSSGFKGNTDEMKESLKALGYSLLYDVIGFVQGVTETLAVSMPYLGKLWDFIMAGIVKAFEFAMISVIYLFSATLDAMKDMFANSWIGNIYGKMLKVTNFVAIPLADLLNPAIPDNIRYPEQMNEIAEAEKNLAEATTDSEKKTAQARLKGAKDRLASVKGNKDSLQSIIDIVKKSSDKLTKSIFDADLGTKLGEFAKGGLNSLASVLAQMRTGIAGLYEKTTGKNIDVALRKRLSGAAEAEIIKSLAKAAAKANAAGKKLGEGVGDSINKGIASLKEDFGMKVFSNADSLMEKFVENMKTNLDSQKDKAIEAFDQQIESIEALADAEERLTAKMEYEEKRRELIKSKELDRENYLRERKVASYEGRTEDVRGLDLAFRKSSKDAQKELSDLDLDRRKELQAEQRGLAIAVINKQKDELTKEYEKMFKEFEQRLDRIKTRGFSTQEEFATLLKDLGSAGTQFSGELAKTFETSMLALPAAIKTVTDPAIGMFTIAMDKLILEAKNHFGSSTGVPDVNSVLGAAYALVTGLPNTFKQAFNTTLIATYVTPFASKLKSDLAAVVPKNLWVEAGIAAVNELMNEMKRQIRAKMTGPDSIWEEFKKIFAELDPSTIPNFADFFPMPDPGVDPFEPLKKRIKELMDDLAALKSELVIIDDLANKGGDEESSGQKSPGAGDDPYALAPGFFTGKSGIGGGLPDFSKLPENYRYNAKTRTIQVKINAMTKEQLAARGIDSEAAARIGKLQGGYVDESASVLKQFSYAGKQGVLKGLVKNPGMELNNFANKGVLAYLMPNVIREAEATGEDIAKSVKGGFDTEIKVNLPTKELIGEYNEAYGDSPNLGTTAIDDWINKNIRPAIKNAKEKGKEIVKSLKDGIIEAFGSPSEWVDFKSWWGRLISIVKGIFGIESPSKVFFGIGKDIMQGLIDGIASLSATPANIISTAFGGIKTKIEDIATTVTTKWSTEISPKLVEWRNYVANDLSTAFGTAKGKFAELASGFKTGYDDYISPTFAKMKGFLEGEQGLGKLVGELKEGFGEIPSSFNSGWNTFVDKWNLNVVGGLVKQLGAQAKNALGFVAAKLGKFYNGGKVGAFTGSGPTLYNGGKVGSYMQGGMTYMKGGMMYGSGGMTQGPVQQAIPAILHGGEYVINNKAVQRIGTDTLDALNNMKLSKPRYPKMSNIPNVNMPNLKIDNSTMAQSPAGSSTQNVNIYVDTFVGEPEWFNSMMKDYNTRVLPRNQKAAGLQNRTISTYNGLNKGG